MFKLIFFSLSLSAFIASAQQPLCLIENKGQVTDQYGKPRRDIDYKIPGKGVNVFVSGGGLHYQFVNHGLHDLTDYHENLLNPQRPFATVQNARAKGEVEMYRLDVELLNARKGVQAVAEQKTGYYENYYLPQCPDGITAYAYNKITYKDVYPNIDWVVYIKNGKAEYDFVVKEGGDVSNIRLQYSGMTSLTQNADGGITATTPMGTVSEAAPICYDASGKKVNALFIVENNTISFSTENYKGQLTIDPTLQWATYYGGSGTESIRPNVTSDIYGNIFLAGATTSSTNIATSGSHQVSYGGTGNLNNGDIFIAKLDSSGVRQWSTYIGGNGDEYCWSTTTDNIGNLYITGMSSSSSTIATTNAHQTIYGGAQFGTGDAILIKLNNLGVRIWGTYYGGTSGETGMSVIYDGGANIYLCGTASSSNAITTPGAHQTNFGGGMVADAFLAKFDTAGVRQWGTFYGGNGEDLGYSVALDATGNIIMSGITSSTNNIATNGSYQNTYAGGNTSLGTFFGDAFIVKFDSAGVRQWGTYYGGAENDWGWIVNCDGANNIYLSGQSASSTGIASIGSYQSTYAGGTANYGDGFIVKFDSTGDRIWGTYYGNTGDDVFYKGFYKSDNLYYAGFTTSISGIATNDGYQTNYGGGNSDAILAVFDTSGQLVTSTYYGGSATDQGYGISISNDGGIYFSGITTSTNGISTTGSHQQNIGGGQDAFLVKFNDTALSVKPSLLIPANTIHLYPNPNAGGFTLTGSIASRDGKATIAVMDVTGRIVAHEETVILNNKLHREVNINTLLPAGLYIVQLTTDSERQVLQMVKE